MTNLSLLFIELPKQTDSLYVPASRAASQCLNCQNKSDNRRASVLWSTGSHNESAKYSVLLLFFTVRDSRIIVSLVKTGHIQT